MSGAVVAAQQQGKRPRGRPVVGELGPTARSKQPPLVLPEPMFEALEAERAGMVGMPRAELLRRIVADGLRNPKGPSRRWGSGVVAGNRHQGATRRFPVAWGEGQAAGLDARAVRLSGVEGVPVSRNEVVRRMVARWLARRNTAS